MAAHGGPLALVVRFTLRPGAEAAFDALVADTAEGIREHEPGTLIYACHQVDGQPRQRIFYELYRDQAAFDAHEASEHTRRFLAERTGLLRSTQVDVLHLADGKTPLTHQVEAVVAGTQQLLRSYQQRARILRAALTAIEQLDTVRALTDESGSAAAVQQGLMDLLDIDQDQARAILDVQLRRLAVQEGRQLAVQYAEVTAGIADCESILASRQRQLDLAATERGAFLARHDDRRPDDRR